MKKNTKKKIENKIKIFSQDTGIFVESFIVTNCTEKSKILKFVKKQYVEEFYEKFDRMITQEHLDSIKNEKDGAVTFTEAETKTVILIVIPSMEDAWTFLDSINHEIAHVVHYLSIRKGFEGETEAKAYLHEYLFREIRRKFYK